ncbi:P1 family peptidase [Anaerococcus lactolyticus]|uniref:Peptidase n=1 Tax=Anaerococcus lactolyticus S7-1-13 TaxID=1284686 RepID=A0A095WZU9_9FIRM|nr:P1 family peptidase [Anaerococcus lactolyticus]KGF03305.1 peptidase [Anaerococcus lactolyticus S7-1-13]
MYSGYFTDVGNIKVGHAQDLEGGTGLTIIIPDSGNTAGVDVRGGAPGTRETDLLNPINQVSEVSSIILSGGSAYGLEAASHLMKILEKEGRGFNVGVGVVPIISQAVLFDLSYKDSKARPDAKMTEKAYNNARYEDKSQGIVGAGTGATVAKALGPDHLVKSGLGQASIKKGDLVVSAIVAVNAFGDIFDYHKALQLAGPIVDGKMLRTVDMIDKILGSFADIKPANTTIGAVATNATFTKTELTKIAGMAHDGYARSINPVHTLFDGDTIFSLATNKVQANINLVGTLAAEAMSMAIANAIYSSREKNN